jgi:Type IV secretory pathway, VirB10 components
MKKLLVAMTAFAALSAAAQAALVCASAPELKVLQSTALQQQLMVAALTCQMRGDYDRFVAAYRDGLIQSDTALKAFFAARPRGEDYHAYKTRIANAASLRSVRDPQFCDSARKVFDMALGRRLERRGLAPEPPQLVDTGYEGCRAVDNRLIEAKAQPAAKLAAIPKPAPRPAGVPVKLAAAPPVRLAPVPTAKPVRREDVPRPHVAIALPKPAPSKPVQVAAVAPNTQVAKPLPVAPTVSMPVQVAAVAPKAAKPMIAAKPLIVVKPMRAEPEIASKPAEVGPASALPPPRAPAVSPRVAFAPSDRPRWRADDSTPSADEDLSLFERETAVAEPPRRPVRQEWRRTETADPDDPYADNPIPSAYRPGAEWVRDGGARRSPSAWDYRSPPYRSYWVRDRDGRWILVIPGGRQARD